MIVFKEVLLQWFINFFIKKTSGSGIKNENISNKELDEDLCKPIIRKFKNRKVHSPFVDNIWGADLNKRIRFSIIFLVNTHGLFL